MAEKVKKTLKVYGKYVRQFKGAKLNPEIRLTGNWVSNWGFKCGDSITVRSLENGIILINEGIKHSPIIHL